MTNRVEQENPFAVQTPEDIPATTIVSLFVDVFTDFYHIPHAGHTFLNGPRGCGKSMMFRYLEPDCQQEARKVTLKDLPFFGVYVPIKNTELKLTEFNRLTNKHAEVALGEHFLVSYVAVKFFGAMLKAVIPDPDGENAKIYHSFHTGKLAERLRWSGWNQPFELSPTLSLAEMIGATRDLFTEYYVFASTYLKKLALAKEVIPYGGPLLGYLDFLLPLLREIKNFPFMPQGPIFLLIDDADNLNLVQTQILNGWVSSRTSLSVSLKISTQLNYKTHLTVARQLVSAPHDYNEVNISSVYTSEKNRYTERVDQIVCRRLQNCGINASAESFFPPYEKQEEEIAAIGDRIRSAWATDGRGSRARDDVTRYARPDYIRGLQGTSKSGSTYRYAGFNQLVHVSSGVVRYFLESASSMFGEMRAKTDGGWVYSIDPATQDKVVREEARRVFFGEFEEFEATDPDVDPQVHVKQIKQLKNLIKALGGMFHAILISETATERRVFSVALTDEDDEGVLAIFKLGVQLGFFHESSIGNKEGTGRARLFILSRRLAPLFTLDPSSFAAHKFATTKALRFAIDRPELFVRRFETGQMDVPLSGAQFELFDDVEVSNV